MVEALNDVVVDADGDVIGDSLSSFDPQQGPSTDPLPTFPAHAQVICDFIVTSLRCCLVASSLRINMSYINSYTNDLLIEFLDAIHDQIKARLQQEFGDQWFRDGVERHLHRSTFDRAREMLQSPMATVDMGKTDEELYGVEHLSSILLGNWPIFQDDLKSRSRTEVYLGEIAELRHNVSHRRQRHMLRRRELLRFVRNAQMLLDALGSPRALDFDMIATHLEQGGSPWGNELGGILPSETEIVSEFVGREAEIQKLSMWLAANSSRQYVIWGYGGSGKSALAYHFARAVRDGAPTDLQAVLWLSAKSQEYVEGETRSRRADFSSVESFGQALWAGLYDAVPSRGQSTNEGILKELSDTPCLVIVDDLDSVLDDDELTHFLLYGLRESRSRIVYTTRHRVPGLQGINVEGFHDDELQKFIRSRGPLYELDVDECLGRLPAIRSVTDSFPLFVDDLMRHAMLGGLESAIGAWSQRKGDAAREYALRRQLSALGEAPRRALIAVSVSDRSVSSLEVSTISGFTDDDIQQAIQYLLRWRLINRVDVNANGQQTFSCNRNTSRLVLKTYGRDPIFDSYREAFRTLSGSTRPPALRRAVGSIISNARALVLRGDFDGAEESLRSSMTGDLANNADLWGALGWVLSRSRVSESIAEARDALRKSHRLGSRKEDTYFHWIAIERDIAEGLVNRSNDQELLKQWRAAERIAQLGIDRCGETPLLCQNAAYLKTREAKTLEHLNQFTSAQACFEQGAEWARRGLSASNPSFREVTKSQLYRTLVHALEGAGDPDETIEALMQWEEVVGSDDFELRKERDRLSSLPEYRGFHLW